MGTEYVVWHQNDMWGEWGATCLGTGSVGEQLAAGQYANLPCVMTARQAERHASELLAEWGDTYIAQPDPPIEPIESWAARAPLSHVRALAANSRYCSRRAAAMLRRAVRNRCRANPDED